MEDLKKRAFDLLLQKFNVKEGMVGAADIFDLCECVISMAEGGFEKESRIVLDLVLKKYDRGNLTQALFVLRGVVFYLNFFSDCKFVRRYVGEIKKILKMLERMFDDVFLLLFRDYDGRRGFFSLDNAIFLSFADILSDFLARCEYVKLSLLCLSLKSKIELGFLRYFYQERNGVFLSFFEPEGSFEIAEGIDLVKIFNYYEVDSSFFKKILKGNLNVFKGNSVEDMLVLLNGMKRFDFADYKVQMNKIFEVLKYFPKFVYNKQDFEKKRDIFNSLNKDFSFSFKKLGNKFLVDVDSVSVANLVLRLK